jgi:hypothetical protein
LNKTETRRHDENRKWDEKRGNEHTLFDCAERLGQWSERKKIKMMARKNKITVASTKSNVTDKSKKKIGQILGAKQGEHFEIHNAT